MVRPPSEVESLREEVGMLRRRAAELEAENAVSLRANLPNVRALISNIICSNRIRGAVHETVASIVASIREVELLNPITVSRPSCAAIWRETGIC